MRLILFVIMVWLVDYKNAKYMWFKDYLYEFYEP